MKKYQIEVEVYEREHYRTRGGPKTFEWEYVSEGSLEGNSRQEIFNWCRAQFGRCTGLAPMGWRFVKRFTYDDGTNALQETWVKIVSGAQAPDGFELTERK